MEIYISDISVGMKNMTVNDIIKQITFPTVGYAYLREGTGCRKDTYNSWDDVYEKLNLNPKETIMDLNPYELEKGTSMLIGTPYDIFLYRDDHSDPYVAVATQRIELIIKGTTGGIWVKKVERG